MAKYVVNASSGNRSIGSQLRFVLRVKKWKSERKSLENILKPKIYKYRFVPELPTFGNNKFKKFFKIEIELLFYSIM